MPIVKAVGIGPNIRQADGGVEAEEDDEGQGEVGYYLPCKACVI